MTIFKLPDLGEGLPDAEIHEWFVKPGDFVKTGQPLVAMETAKAVVEVPSPNDGIIAELYGKPGEVIKTGHNLVRYQSNDAPEDTGTVVGNLKTAHETTLDVFKFTEDNTHPHRIVATSNVRLLAAQHKIDLTTVTGSGAGGLITIEDLTPYINTQQSNADYQPLTGVRRNMLKSMQISHHHVVPVSIFDEMNISHWEANADLTVKLIEAIIKACQVEPSLNAWFDNKKLARKLFTEVNLGLAMDSDEGLFVPVIHNAQKYSKTQLRLKIDQYKTEVQNRSITPENLQGATITLSNFGKFAGLFASPIVVPPQVAILAVGRKFDKPVLVNQQLVMQPHLPLSLTFDHRAITGGEATRFLKHIMQG